MIRIIGWEIIGEVDEEDAVLVARALVFKWFDSEPVFLQL